MKTKIFILDDHEIFLNGLVKLLEDSFEIEGSFTRSEDLLQALRSKPVEVLVLDVQLPEISAEDLLQRIRADFPNQKIIYLTLLRGTRMIQKLQKFGIQGYVMKNAPTEELLKGIKTVANGQTYFSKEIDSINNDDDLKNTLTFPDNKVEDILSPREVEILKLVCEEMSSSEIAAKLFLSVSTVDTHRKNILIKLGVSNTVGLVKYALKHQLLK
ncbi:MAG: response regulator transcription factor [Cytophagaceae bacterium]|nr:response regulator transcription factor [Cytophagaceae bacterium]MBK9935049.1 response regulator transcription factor [Cytophagaceae bacterium]MBL0301492.1 response regulator transcription factor [Cytophagaceae bacterium]MBL0324313.1 response regulator transcription factor [Cytophagaceae bacterium]